ncbi:thiol reductant ABC exporter subunit CydC [Kozakia baliensis]|uniref:thiol reductant ABC exporter subunit CydC n=1 Tax=Kozakia baliensis TaxID=153496 RepID=UPI0009DEEC8D|nr:thiol reductant ABC exporter subunit CydC [Kozakia baliensis]
MSSTIRSELTGVRPEEAYSEQDIAGLHVSAGSALKTILDVWRPYRIRLFIGLCLSLLALACGLALMGSAGWRISAMALGFSAGYMVLRLSGLGRIFLRYSERLYAHDAMFRALAGLRVWFYRKLAQGAAAGLGFRRSGDLLSRLVSDIETLDNLYLRLAVPLAGAALTLPVLAVCAWRVSAPLAVVLLVLFLCAALLLPFLAARLARKNSHEILTAESNLRIASLDLATGLREARAFGAEKTLVDRIERDQEVVYASQIRQSRRLATAGALSYLCGQAAIIAILAALAGFGLPHVGAIGGIALLFLTIASFEGVMGLTRAGLLGGQVAHAAQRVVEIADQAVNDRSATQPIPTSNTVIFKNVGFQWQADRKPVFQNLDLTISSGERVAIIGPSGIGKSSLAALLLKVVSPECGQITLGGTDIASLDTDALRHRIAWLSQATHLFDDTVRGNLLLGRTDLSDDALWGALDKAEIGETIRGLPKGLDSWIGEGGARLSGGQGRRIALARTLLMEAPILILDEPATGLDAETEQAFLRTLNKTTQGRTVILIAHRLIGVEQLDRVWRLQDGHAVAAPI